MLRRELLKKVSITTFLSSACAGQSAARRDRPIETPRHDPAQPHRCRIYCVDATRSLLPDQLKKAKAIIRASASTDIRYNDIAWLVSIGSQAQPALSFA